MNYEEFFQEWRSADNEIECQSSGSTGIPQKIILPKSEMIKSAGRTITHFHLSDSSHLHSCISPKYIGGKMMAVRAEECGAKLTWEVPSNKPLRNYKDGVIDLLAIVPSQMLYILDNKSKMPEIRHILIGGSPLNSNLRKKICESGFDTWETYGMTETSSHIALRRIEKNLSPFSPLEGIKVTADKDSRLVIEMEGWQTITTNDIARVDEDGNFEITGRYDNVIISGGKKIHPEIVEDLIESYTGLPVLIYGKEDEKWGHRVEILVEDPGCKYEDKVLMDIFHKILPPESIPKRIFRAQLPLTSNGKKKRK